MKRVINHNTIEIQYDNGETYTYTKEDYNGSILQYHHRRKIIENILKKINFPLFEYNI
jgi:hypothetical protein